MTPVEPSAFAAQLIARLDRLKREQDTMSSLEERLQQIQEVRKNTAHALNMFLIFRMTMTWKSSMDTK